MYGFVSSHIYALSCHVYYVTCYEKRDHLGYFIDSVFLDEYSITEVFVD